MTSDRDDLSKVTKHIHEAKVMGIAILAPDVNESDKEFVATKHGIRFAMVALKEWRGRCGSHPRRERKKGPYKSSMILSSASIPERWERKPWKISSKPDVLILPNGCARRCCLALMRCMRKPSRSKKMLPKE